MAEIRLFCVTVAVRVLVYDCDSRQEIDEEGAKRIALDQMKDQLLYNSFDDHWVASRAVQTYGRNLEEAVIVAGVEEMEFGLRKGEDFRGQPRCEWHVKEDRREEDG